MNQATIKQLLLAPLVGAAATIALFVFTVMIVSSSGAITAFFLPATLLFPFISDDVGHAIGLGSTPGPAGGIGDSAIASAFVWWLVLSVAYFVFMRHHDRT
jgi:membrane associated rhomboid family serine protease